MHNILPVEENKKVVNEYRLRFLTVAISAIGALILSSLILLVPSYLLALSKYRDATSELEMLQKKDGSSDYGKSVNMQVLEINKKINTFLKTSTALAPSLSSVIEKILEVKGDSIKITGFVYGVNGEQERVVITGTARSRETLARFIEVLKKDPSFTSVELPISSYVKSTDVDFSAAVVVVTKK